MASWAYGYNSLEELVSAADIIIAATIVGLAIIDTDGGMEHSVSMMHVEEVLKDHKRRATIERFSVRQTGTRAATNTLGDPIFKRGQRVVLFMCELLSGLTAALILKTGRFSQRRPPRLNVQLASASGSSRSRFWQSHTNEISAYGAP